MRGFEIQKVKGAAAQSVVLGAAREGPTLMAGWNSERSWRLPVWPLHRLTTCGLRSLATPDCATCKLHLPPACKCVMQRGKTLTLPCLLRPPLTVSTKARLSSLFSTVSSTVARPMRWGRLAYSLGKLKARPGACSSSSANGGGDAAAASQHRCTVCEPPPASMQTHGVACVPSCNPRVL